MDVPEKENGHDSEQQNAHGCDSYSNELDGEEENDYFEPSNFKIPVTPVKPKPMVDDEIPASFKKKRRVTIADLVDVIDSVNDLHETKKDERCGKHQVNNETMHQMMNMPRKNVPHRIISGLTGGHSPMSSNAYYNRTRKSRYSVFISGIEQFDPYQELTPMQILAFRQVFDMVDKDGGGSIDADELYTSMKDLEANLNLEEIKEILEELDRDGEGEIDFEEFLYMMTSMSLQIKEAQHDNDAYSRKCQPLNRNFFNVITKFAMKHSLKEIERYYASKSRYTPHVVGHYAAGARVDGLSEKELRKTWQDLSIASKGKDSPYAQPLNFVISSIGTGMKKTIRYKKKGSDGGWNALSFGGSGKSSPSSQTSDFSSRGDASTSCVDSSRGRDSSRTHSRQTSPSRASSMSRPESIVGWTPRHRLPIANCPLPVVCYESRKKLTIEDMSGIREKVNSARHSYYDRLMTEKETNAMQYWDALKVGEIQSKRLQVICMGEIW